MKGREIAIEADVGVGKGKAKVGTCYLTHRYIDINGSSASYAHSSVAAVALMSRWRV